ncbi:substrate-binding region of ABC-type glycine betaine transporter [Gracilibacillus halophilus YIM-C55.5]|uniref:Substrate-binding region of ABC-type glycine betaine transporter n=1 Tax=Gracilibacillus halophilus YIM-C55.5 TaxID=1308866 RepID=N4WI25_9BACI|nr:glycine betaine ABC transporter substrate-binding protein [Gracilibacillus halophilus]ENH95827.1 substrate-binding region of ABC-type glycine betaine transporter [Gracilibacillus halophilus YIM-C55.5]
MKKLITASVLSFLLLILAACGDETSADGGEVFEFGAQKNTDPKIMGHIVKQLVEAKTDHEVNITEDIPASPQVMTAIGNKEFDFALLYSGEVYNNHFDEDQVEYSTDPEKTLTQAQELFGNKYDMKWYDSVGFRNQYSIAIKEELANENNITNMTELGDYASELALGTDNSWIERENDGYEGYQETYGYSFKEARGMDVALMYEGIANGDLDVVTAYTVDPQILEYNLKILEDDQNFFPPYDASLVARNEVINEYPAVEAIFNDLVGSVSTDEMTQLIREVDMNERDMATVAEEFIQEKGWLE